MTTEAVPQLVRQVEVDETYGGGKERNKPKGKRRPLNGTAGENPGDRRSGTPRARGAESHQHPGHPDLAGLRYRTGVPPRGLGRDR